MKPDKELPFRFLLSILTVAVSLVFFCQGIRAGSIEVTYEEGLLSVSAEESTVEEIMAAVQSKTKVNYRFNGKPPVTKESVYFAKMDVKEGIKEILSFYFLDNYLFSEQEGQPGGVESVEIYCSSSTPEQSAPLSPDDYLSDSPVIYEDGSLTINVNEESVLAVISDLEAETGILFNITGDIPEEEITVKVSKSPLKKGLESVFSKLPLKSYKFNYGSYTDAETVIESVDLVFSAGEEEITPEEKVTTEKTGEGKAAVVSSEKIEDASDKYAPPGSKAVTSSGTGKRIYSTEIRDASADYRPPISSSGTGTSGKSGIYGQEFQGGSGAGPGIYGSEHRSSGSGPGIYGTERRNSGGGPGIYGNENR